MNVGAIRGYLLQHPKPATVRVHTVAGEIKDIAARNFQKAAESVHALDPELIECLDKDGGLLRAKRVGASISPSDEQPLPKAIEDDPTAAAFALYARLLGKAYEHSTEVAFTKMVELVERMNERSDSIERRLERSESAHRRAVQEQIEDALDRADEAAAAAEGGSLQEQMASAFLSGAMPGMSGGQPAPTAPSNGKPGPARARNGASNGAKGHD